jgi:predicted membrane-bound spermidine synthase
VTRPAHDAAPLRWLEHAFFLSGIAALTYQVAWERVLFVIFGINTEAVTVVVTAFLLGLGVGSAVGGWISKRPGCRHLRWFGGAELAIAAFGALSVPFYHVVGRLTLGLDPVATAAVTFLLVLLPTMLMGATLPLLVAYAVRASGSVGWSVGTLYHVNTAGSAIAAVLTVTLLLPYLGLQGTVLAAGACNCAAALMALRRDRAAEPVGHTPGAAEAA